MQKNCLFLDQNIEKSLCHKNKKGFLYLGKYFFGAYPIRIMLEQTQKKSMMAFQNFCILPNNLNQNSCGSINTVWIEIEDIVEISLNNKNYKKPNMYYYGQIAAILAFSTTNPKLLSSAKSIFKQKVQAKKQLATSKTIRYGI